MALRFRFLFAMLAVAVALSARSAEAAVLLPELEAVLAGEGSAVGTSSVPTRPLDLEEGSDQTWPRFEQDPCLAPNAPASSAGTSSTVTAGAPSATLAGTVHLDGATLVTYLTRESRVLLSVPFLSGVFRPPRVIG